MGRPTQKASKRPKRPEPVAQDAPRRVTKKARNSPKTLVHYTDASTAALMAELARREDQPKAIVHLVSDDDDDDTEDGMHPCLLL